MSQYPAVIRLSTLDGDNGFQINGEVALDYSGFSVASAGDVNGDGFADVIVGTPRADPYGEYSGAAYVVFGKASGFAAAFELSSLDGNNGFQISGDLAYDYTGRSVASAGDFNGDGFGDFIVGAYVADTNGTESGASYVMFGKASGFVETLEVSSLDGNNGFQINGAAAGDFSGHSVSSAGDVNGDGFDDVVIGAYNADPNGSYSGAAFVVFGAASGFGVNFALADVDGNNGFKINGEAAGDRAGFSVSSARDVNGDGFDDLIVGAEFASPSGAFSGTSYVVFGKGSNFDSEFELSNLNGNNGFKIIGEAASDRSGGSVALAGDINADGFADLIVGAEFANPNGVFSGASYVVFGKADGFKAIVKLAKLNGTDGFQISGGAASDFAGCSVASAGDVNGDGFDDLIVGARGADPRGSVSGASYVIFGKAGVFDATLELSDLDGSNGFRIDGEDAGDVSGISASSAGDVNGDGLADLIIGAYGADPNGGESGASYVVFGLLPDQAVNRTGTVASQNLVGGDFDDTLSGQGGDDTLFGHGGDDTIAGGDGNDTADAGSGDDSVRGGSGADTLRGGDDVDELRGGSNGDALFGDDGSDVLDGGSGNDRLDGGVGNDALNGSDGVDALSGGDGDDRMTGGDGQDTLAGGAGVDRFIYTSAADSTSAGLDTVKGADFAADVWDVQGNVTGIDATIASGNLSSNNFDSRLEAAADAAHLDERHAVIFTPDAGNLAGKTFLVVDQNGIAGYQGGIDLVIELRNAANLGALDENDFI